MAYLLMLVSITLTFMLSHSVSAKATIPCLITSTTKQTTSIKLSTTVGHLVHDLDFANVYMV